METEKALVQYGGFGCLVPDASSNANNESVVNYMIVVGKKSLLVENVYTGDQGHTSDFIANDLSRVIKKVKQMGVAIAGGN
jgi:hypothetical protein